MKRSVPSLIAALAVGLLLAGGQAFATSAATPPLLEVQGIGEGVVTGTGIDCGDGEVKCESSYGTDPATVTLHAKAHSGWAFDSWDGCDAPAGTTCTQTISGGTPETVTAVFTTTGGIDVSRLTVSPTDNGTVENGSTTYGFDCSTTNPTPTCEQTVPTGSTLTLHETPNTGFLFDGWAGACSGRAQTCSLHLTGNKAASASFVSSATTTLTVIVDGPGTVTGGGINCSPSSTCTAPEPPTARLQLTATPADGYAFTGWEGATNACAGPQPTCTVDMSADQTVEAGFDKVVPVLVTVNGAGTVSGSDITCGPGPSTCSGNATPGSTIQFRATPTTAGGTVTWLGCTSASGTVCNVVVGTNPISVTASFSGGTAGGGGGGSFVALNIDVEGDGYVTALSGATIYCTAAGGAGCTANVQQNTSVTLRAQAASGSSSDFDNWATGCVSTTTTCTVVMSSAKQVTANFEPNDNTTYDLTASVVGGGTVTGSGLNSCKITNSANCASPQAANAHVTINAQANPGQEFVGWSGACTGNAPTCTLVMDSDQNVTATFKAGAVTSTQLTIAIAGAGTVSGTTSPCVGKAGKQTTCSATEKQGASVTLKETPAKGYVFVGWTGACSGAKPTCAVAIVGDTEVLATFKPAPLAAGAKKPIVKKLSSGYRVTITFRAGEAGRLTVTTKPKTATIHKTLKKAGASSVLVKLKKHGRYVITLSLKSKSGTHALRYTVKV